MKCDKCGNYSSVIPVFEGNALRIICRICKENSKELHYKNAFIVIENKLVYIEDLAIFGNNEYQILVDDHPRVFRFFDHHKMSKEYFILSYVDENTNLKSLVRCTVESMSLVLSPKERLKVKGVAVLEM